MRNAQRSFRQIMVLGVVLWGVGMFPALALAAPTVGAPVASPASITAGQATELTVTSQVTGDTANPVIPTGVNLLRVDAANKVIRTLGTMRDDGANGDAVAGDKIFTLRLSVTESGPGELRSQVSAPFQRILRRVLSGVAVVPVQVAGPLAVPPSTPIRDAVGDVLIKHPISPGEISIDAFGRQIVLRELEIVFRATATAGEVNSLLNGIGATIYGSIAGTRSLAVRIPDPGSLAALDALVAQIEAHPFVWFVRKGIIPKPNALPSNISPGSETPPFDTTLYAIRHHLAVKAHAAWNVAGAISDIPRVVVTDYFGAGAPDNTYLASITVDSTDFAQGASPARVGYDHGYHVLGIISGSFGGDNTPPGLVTGMNPAPVILRAVDLLGDLPSDIDYELLTLDRIRELGGPNVVLNTSLAADCTQNGPCTDMDEANRFAVLWVEKVRARGLEDRVLHVTGAGNIKEPFLAARDAVTKGNWNTATLLPEPGLTDEFNNPVPNLTNTLSIENAVTALVAESALASTPFRVKCLSESSFVGGSLSAIGTEVFSFTATGTDFFSGTSMATPQVAGLAAYLWSIDPSLIPQQLIAILTNTANPVPVPVPGDPDCSDWPTPARSIDAYAAVLALDTGVAPNLARVRLALLDVGDGLGSGENDGFFKEDDLSLLASLVQDPTGPLDYSRFDLNGDGRTGGPTTATARFDLDINDPPAWTPVNLDIGGTQVSFDESNLTDQEILCYYAYSPLYRGAETGPLGRDELAGPVCGILPFSLGRLAVPGFGVVSISLATPGLTAPMNWTVPDGGLPGGFSLVDNVVNFQIELGNPGAYSFTVTATDVNGLSRSRTYSGTILFEPGAPCPVDEQGNCVL
ncbi:MAG: S8 family serine peptidase [Syntrophobacteraceae bacterium]